MSRLTLTHRPTGFVFILLLAGILLSVLCGSQLSYAASPAFTPEQQYEALLQEYQALQADKKKAGLRENWDKLQKKFADLAKQKNNTAPKALFQQAKVQESLAKRSSATKDYELALGLFAQMPDKYPKHALSAEALYCRALILEKLGRADNAKKDLERIIKQYKNGDAFTKASNKLKELNTATPSAKPEPAANVKEAVNVREEPRAGDAEANAAKMYAEAVKVWKALLADKEKGKKSSNWLAVADDFYKAYAQSPKSAVAPKGLFQMARAYEELGLRLQSKDGWEKAVAGYLRLAKEFPRDSLSDDALYLAANIKYRRLNQSDEAKMLAERVLKEYPKGDMLGNAQRLLAAIDKDKGKKAGVVADGNKGTKAANSVCVLDNITWSGTPQACTVTFSFSQAADFKYEFLEADKKSGRPAQLVVLLSNVSQGPDIRGTKKISGLPVTRVRPERVAAGKSLRVIFDVASDVKEYKVNSLENPYRINFELSRRQGTLKGGMALALGESDKKTADKKQPATKSTRDDKEQGKAQEKPVQAAPTAPVAIGKQAGGVENKLADQLGLNIKTIMIDAGHGGKDPGAMAGGVVEKKITLQAAKMLGDKLVKLGFKVIYSRDKDVFISLQERPTMANSRKADLFISLHINANNDSNISGLETYYLDVASSSNAVRVAARENGVSVSKISDLQAILADFMLDSRLTESRELAQYMHNSIHKTVRQNGFKIGDNGVRSAPFYVLMGARMPAVLIEAGYLTNASDLSLLKNEAYLHKFTDGIASAIVAYKRKIALSTVK